MKVLVLGSTGMAGHVVYSYLDKLDRYDLIDVSFRKKLNPNSILLDVRFENKVTRLIRSIKPDVIVNCIGVLLRGSQESVKEAVFINSYLPHKLVDIVNGFGGRVIHLSTDCVFSGKKGEYIEDDFRDADDIYGRSKALGEISADPHLTIRTSIIGPELKLQGEGLFHWLVNQEGPIEGYSNSLWSGVTTYELARAIDSSIQSGMTGIYHLTNGKKISKYDLLKSIIKIWNLDTVQLSKTNGKSVDKTLIDSRNEISPEVSEYNKMLNELMKYMQVNSKLYSHYVNISL